MTDQAYLSRVVRGQRAREGDSMLKEEGGQSPVPLHRKTEHGLSRGSGDKMLI